MLHSRAESQSVAEATLEREEGNPFSHSVSKDNNRKLESDGFHYHVAMCILLPNDSLKVKSTNFAL